MVFVWQSQIFLPESPRQSIKSTEPRQPAGRKPSETGRLAGPGVANVTLNGLWKSSLRPIESWIGTKHPPKRSIDRGMDTDPIVSDGVSSQIPPTLSKLPR